MATNFTVKTQAAAYAEGYKDAMRDLINARVSNAGRGVNYMIERLEDNARPEDRARLVAFYDSQETRA